MTQNARPLRISDGHRINSLQRLIALAGVCGIMMLGGLITPDGTIGAYLADRIVAVVNTEVITLSELKAAIAEEEATLKARYQGRQLKHQLQQLEYETLNSMIEHKLQMQAAESMGLDVSEDEVSRTIQELQRRNNGIDPSDPDAQQNVRERLILMKLVEREVRSGVMISDEDVREYYEEHKTRYTFPREYRISQILFGPRTGEDAQAVRERAEAVFRDLQDGADFGDLAVRHSEGAEAVRGGNLGTVREGEILPSIETLIKNMEPGEISKPLETSLGLHIIRLDEKKPPRFRPFDAVRQQIRERLYHEKTQEMYRTWIAELKDKAYIEVKF